VHWSSPPRWWLASLTRAREAVRPELRAGRALEQVAAGSGAMMLALLLLALTPLLAWRLGPVPAAVFALAWTGVFPLYETFLAGVVDHHGLVAMAALLGAVCLVIGGAGWVREGPLAAGHGVAVPDLPSARRWFAAAGVVSGFGLWLSAATTIPVVVGTAAGAVAAWWAGRRTVGAGVGDGGPEEAAAPGARRRPAPELWRLWGAAGCATSLLAYAVEYAPSHVGLRLEVNHPLHALAWLGAGDVVTRVWRREWRKTGPALLLAAAPALALLATGGSAFLLADPFLRTLHAGGIREFQGLAGHLAGASAPRALLSVSALPAAAALLLWMAWPSPATRRCPSDAARLAVAGAPAFLLLALALWQVRWLPTASAALLVVVLTSLALGACGASGRGAGVPGSTARRALVGGALVLVIAPFPLATALFPWRAGYPAFEEAPQVVARDAAYRIRGQAGGGDVVVAAPPLTTTWLIWFGGFRGLGTLYWENEEGLRAWEAVVAEPTGAGLRERLARLGVTHVLVPTWEPLAPATSPRGFLARALAGEERPSWLVPFGFPESEIPALRGLSVRGFRVRAAP
jgi:hypothetical protein